MRNLFIDGDPGHDDVIAFLMALAHKELFHVLGFTTVSGNASVENTTANILKIMDYLNVKIPVAKGYETPLCKPLSVASKFHGETGLDGASDYPNAHTKPLNMHAIELMKKVIADNKVTLVTMGPLTNVAVFLKTYPELKKNIDEIVIMGGSMNSGNTLAKAEFNMYADPDAAKIVVEAGVPIVLVPCEACQAAGIALKDIEKLKEGGKVSRLIYDILKFYSRYAVNNGWDYVSIYDMSTVMYLIDPSAYKKESYPLSIETDGIYTRGMTVCDYRPAGFVNDVITKQTVLLDADAKKVSEIFFESISLLDEQYQ